MPNVRLERPGAAPSRGVTLLAAASLLWAMTACNRSEGEQEAGTEQASASAAPEGTLPKLELRDDTANLLLTWIDEAGEFHVGDKLTDVPDTAKQRVRVVKVDNEEGTGKYVYVANLAQKDSSGVYAVEVWPREQWDELGAERRKSRMEAYTPPAPSAGAEQPLAASQVKAVVYGADWCKPCHQAEDLLRSLGVDVVKKDIEESPAAAAEMRQKLAAANQHGASIPVIDVAGKVFVGFNAGAIKKAVNRARGIRL